MVWWPIVKTQSRSSSGAFLCFSFSHCENWKSQEAELEQQSWHYIAAVLLWVGDDQYHSLISHFITPLIIESLQKHLFYLVIQRFLEYSQNLIHLNRYYSWTQQDYTLSIILTIDKINYNELICVGLCWWNLHRSILLLSLSMNGSIVTVNFLSSTFE